MSAEAAAWLREQVEARLRLAREACHGTDGHWWRRAHDVGDGGPPEPVGPLYSGGLDVGPDGEVFGGEFIVAYDEGAPSGAQFDHMEANDPRDVIARCEAELAILDAYEGQVGYDLPPGVSEGRDDDERLRDEAVRDTLGDVVRLIASGYRHRDGYKEALRP